MEIHQGENSAWLWMELGQIRRGFKKMCSEWWENVKKHWLAQSATTLDIGRHSYLIVHLQCKVVVGDKWGQNVIVRFMYMQHFLSTIRRHVSWSSTDLICHIYCVKTSQRIPKPYVHGRTVQDQISMISRLTCDMETPTTDAYINRKVITAKPKP